VFLLLVAVGTHGLEGPFDGADRRRQLAGARCQPVAGPPGVGKTHLRAAIGHSLIEHGYRVLYTRTSDLVQRLKAARRDLRLSSGGTGQA